MYRPTSSTAFTAAAMAMSLLVIPLVATTASAATAPAMPTGLKVVRDVATPTDLAVTWKPVAAVDHYTVGVFDGATDHLTTVPATATSFAYPGAGDCTRYRVRVSSVSADGTATTTPDYLVNPLASGGVSGVKATRSNTGDTASIAWTAPVYPGLTPLKGYNVSIVQPSTGKTLVNRFSADAAETLTGLNPASVYIAKIKAFNSFGSCVTSTVLLGNDVPSAVAAWSATRDPGVPAQIDLTWKAPLWQGYGPLQGYLVGYGTSVVTTWVKVAGTSLSLNLDPKVAHVFLVRAINGPRNGALSKVIKMERAGVPGTKELAPQVAVDEANGIVSVKFNGPVGSFATYPKMVVAVRPTMDGTSTFADTQVVHNGAGTAIFSTVPCGVFTFTVTGVGATQTEFGRRIVNRCQDGLLNQTKWKTVFGTAKIAGNDVVMPNGSDTRVMSTTARKSSDMVLTTTATLNSGWGYGIWARANVATGASVTGYSVQYDPGYGRVSSFGKAILLRQWSLGRECGTPLAISHFPAGVLENAAHKVTVVVKGDTLYLSVDGNVVFDVPSLAAAMKASGCGMAAPTGTEIGFRTWGAGTSATFAGTTLS